jgi:hypothetical protein
MANLMLVRYLKDLLTVLVTRPVREGVSTDSLKFHAGLPCPTLIRPAGGRPAAVFFPLGYPTPYGPVSNTPISCPLGGQSLTNLE